MQDDLADLMVRKFHLDHPLQPTANNLSMPPTPQVVPQPAPIAYVTQHYHHSAHLAQAAISDTHTSDILAQAGVDTAALLPSQLQLFRNAAPDQQMRLIELWRIAPPAYGSQMLSRDLGNWPQTCMEQEEEAARHRWETMQQGHDKAPTELSLRNIAEPYMVDGYATRSPSHNTSGSVDHASNSRMTEEEHSSEILGRAREWWNLSPSEPIEHQYGMLQHMQLYGQQLDQSGEEQIDEEML